MRLANDTYRDIGKKKNAVTFLRCACYSVITKISTTKYM